MKPIALLVAALVAVVPLSASQLFDGATESKWNVTKGGDQVAVVTLLTSDDATRAEWRAGSKTPPVVFIAADRKIWVRQTGGDIELSAYKGGVESDVVPALLLPAMTAASDKTSSKGGKLDSYAFSSAKATYHHDAQGPSSVDVVTDGATYTLKRTGLSASTADDSNFSVRPRKGAASRLARLSGDLLGPSQSSVSATAGGRGAGTKGLKFSDGGDYRSVEKIENRDASWGKQMDDALAEFQKDGKVGKGRNQ